MQRRRISFSSQIITAIRQWDFGNYRRNGENARDLYFVFVFQMCTTVATIYSNEKLSDLLPRQYFLGHLHQTIYNFTKIIAKKTNEQVDTWIDVKHARIEWQTMRNIGTNRTINAYTWCTTECKMVILYGIKHALNWSELIHFFLSFYKADFFLWIHFEHSSLFVFSFALFLHTTIHKL